MNEWCLLASLRYPQELGVCLLIKLERGDGCGVLLGQLGVLHGLEHQRSLLSALRTRKQELK